MENTAMARSTALRYEDLASFPDDNLRREILSGELYVTPSPTLRHQHVVGQIFRVLADYADGADGRAIVAPLDTALSAQNVVEPDVVFVAADRMHTLGRKGIFGVPSLVVEVLSPGTKIVDRGSKREIYARFGTPEYWIVDPDANTIERCSRPAGDCYEENVTFESDMAAATLPGLTLTFDKIFSA
ncbi:MAG TPA: Uma2 family endonuclease [Candidatus Baltobacteraceae bacterium]|jgi:Uma2 family endonuclease